MRIHNNDISFFNCTAGPPRIKYEKNQAIVFPRKNICVCMRIFFVLTLARIFFIMLSCIIVLVSWIFVAIITQLNKPNYSFIDIHWNIHGKTWFCENILKLNTPGVGLGLVGRGYGCKTTQDHAKYFWVNTKLCKRMNTFCEGTQCFFEYQDMKYIFSPFT